MSYGHGQYQYATIPLPAQQHSLPYNDPATFIQKPDGLSSSLLAAQERASRKRVVRNTCLIAAAIVISLVGMIFAFLSFICVFHQCQVSGRSIVSTAPLGQVLTISQVTSHVAPLSVPIIMGVFSYLLSARWLRSSISQGPDCPSPMQLGLLMSMCNGGGLSSLFSSVKYTVKRPENGQKVAQPPILRQSILFLGSLLAVTYLTAAADSWLHASSMSINISSNSPYKSLSDPNFGREINDTMCQQASNGNEGPVKTASCGILSGGPNPSDSLALGEGVRVLANASILHRVVLSDDQTAIVVPQSLPSNITYSAQTLGVKSQCMTITKDCLQPTTIDGVIDYGPDAFLNLSCSRAGIKYANGTSQSALCALDSQGMCTYGYDIPSNPFTTGEVATSKAYISQNQVFDQFINNTGWFAHGESGAWNVVFCNVTVLEVTYAYQSSRYVTQSASPKSLAVTQAIMSPGFVGLGTTVVSIAVDGSGLQPNATYEDAYSLELSRQMLSRAGSIYEPANVLRIESENNVNGSKLQVIPLALFIAAMLVLACQVLYIAIRIAVATWGVQYVELAALQLRDPLATMQRLYGHPNPELTWETDSDKRFGFETEADRLRIGPVPLSTNGGPGSVFMITKG